MYEPASFEEKNKIVSNRNLLELVNLIHRCVHACTAEAFLKTRGISRKQSSNLTITSTTTIGGLLLSHLQHFGGEFGEPVTAQHRHLSHSLTIHCHTTPQRFLLAELFIFASKDRQ
jgi:hypothetical protein